MGDVRTESNNGSDEPADSPGIILEFAELPHAAILTVNGMAKIFGKSPNTIMRAVAEGRLPRPFRIFSENCWRAGEVDRHLQQSMQKAQHLTGQQAPGARQDAAPGDSGTLKGGSSPIRLEPHARHSENQDQGR